MITMFSDRTLTTTGYDLLKIVQAQPVTAEQAAMQVSYPLYRVRLNLEELLDVKLVSVQEGRYRLTEAGLLKVTQ